MTHTETHKLTQNHKCSTLALYYRDTAQIRAYLQEPLYSGACYIIQGRQAETGAAHNLLQDDLIAVAGCCK